MLGLVGVDHQLAHQLLEVRGQAVAWFVILRCVSSGELLEDGAALVGNARPVAEEVPQARNELLGHLLVQEDVWVVLTQPREHPTDSLPNFETLVAEQNQQLVQGLCDHFQELLLLRALCNGSQCYQSRVPLLPILCLDVCRHELDDQLHDVVADQQGKCLQAASCRDSRPSIVVIEVTFSVLIIVVEDEQSLQHKLNQAVFALRYVVEAEGALLLSLGLIFNQCRPEFVCLRSHSRRWVRRCCLSQEADLAEIVLEALVLLRAYLSKALQHAF